MAIHLLPDMEDKLGGKDKKESDEDKKKRIGYPKDDPE